MMKGIEKLQEQHDHLRKKFSRRDGFLVEERDTQEERVYKILSQKIASLVVSSFGLAHCESFENKFDRVNFLMDVISRDFSEKEIEDLVYKSQTVLKLYKFHKGSTFPDFILRQFKENGLDEAEAPKYYDIISEITESQVKLITNHVFNSLPNTVKYGDGQGGGSLGDEEQKRRSGGLSWVEGLGGETHGKHYRREHRESRSPAE